MSDSTFQPFALGEGLSIRTQAGGDARSISNGPVPAALEFAKDVTTRITIGGGHEELGVIKHQTADEERNPFAGILSTARNNAGGRTARITDDTRVLIGFTSGGNPVEVDVRNALAQGYLARGGDGSYRETGKTPYGTAPVAQQAPSGWHSVPPRPRLDTLWSTRCRAPRSWRPLRRW